MTTILTPSPVSTLPARLFTAADLAAMPTELPSGPINWELHHGRLVAMPPVANEQAVGLIRLGYHFYHQADLRGHGQTCGGDGGIVLRRNPDHVRAPDLAFIRASRLPPHLSREGYLETIPDLAVEIRSPNDTLAELQRKADDYLTAGVVCVWVIDPVGRQVIESRQGAAPRVIAENDTLTLEDIIPGFALPVRDVLR